MHRDLSPNNILLNMRHNEDCEFDNYPDEKYIHEVLNGPSKEGQVMESVVVIIHTDVDDIEGRKK